MAVQKNIMSKMVRDIYKELVQEMEEDEISRMLKEEVLEVMGDSSTYPDEQIYGEYRDKAFSIANAGEEAGFCRGFRYAMKLFMECIGD